MNKRLISLLLAVLLIIGNIPTAFAANDKAADTANDKATEAANELYEIGLFKGTGTDADGNPTFNLDRSLNRMEAITMLVRLLGKEDEAIAGTWDIPFTDVDDWAKPYVGYAYANGLTKGTSATRFGSKSNVSVSQYLTFVLRALGYSSETDFQWNKAWELSDKIGLTDGSYNEDTTEFLRADVTIISYEALEQPVVGTEQTLLTKIQTEIAESEAAKDDDAKEEDTQSSTTQNGTAQSGNSQSGNNQSGNSQNGNNQNGNNQNGNNQNGNNQNGGDQNSDKQDDDNGTGLSLSFYDVTDARVTFGISPGANFTFDVYDDGAKVTNFAGYDVKSSNTAVCTAEIEGEYLIVKTTGTVQPGDYCSITITKGSISESFIFHYGDYQPTESDAITSLNFTLGEDAIINTGNEWNIFRNPGESFEAVVIDSDSGIPITSQDGYTVTLTDGNVCSYAIKDDGSLTLTALAAGNCTVTIEAKDDPSKYVQFTFNVWLTNSGLSVSWNEFTEPCTSFGCDPGQSVTLMVFNGGVPIANKDDYSVALSNPDMCAATKKDDGSLELTALTEGDCTVTLTVGSDTTWYNFHSENYQESGNGSSNLTLQYGDTVRNSGEGFGFDRTNNSITYTVCKDGTPITDYAVTFSNKDVFSAAINGSELTFTALKYGEATATITSGDDSMSFNLRCVAPTNSTNLSLGMHVTISGSEFNIFVFGSSDSTVAVTVCVDDKQTDAYEVTVGDEDVCEATKDVDGTLVLRVKKAGESAITITTEDETMEGSICVYGSDAVGPDIGETGLSIGYYDYTDTGSTIGFAPGNTLTYDICYNGMIVNDLDGYGVKSSDETVCTAKFDNGQLTIETLKAGTCTVTITKGEESASFGFASDGYMPDLSEVVRESNLSLGNHETANTNNARNIFRNIGETFTATVLNGSSAITSKDGYTVTLSDGNVCSYTIEDDGSLTLTALATGKCTVTITSKTDLDKSVVFTFNVS